MMTFSVATIEDTPLVSAFADFSGYRTTAADAAGRFADNYIPGADSYDIKRFHSAGVSGNWIVRNGRVSGLITLAFTYIGAYDKARELEEEDKARWANTAVIITDDIGEVRTRYNLISDGYRRINERPIGFTFGAKQFVRIDAQAVFTRDS